MQKFLPNIFILSVICLLTNSSVFAQNKPKLVVQKFEVQKGVQISHENLDLLMNSIVNGLKRTKKFSEVQRFSPPYTTDPNADFTPPTDYLIKGIITKHTSPGMFTKIMSYGMIDETKVYLTFTLTDRKTGLELLKKDVKGKISQSILFNMAFEPAYKISDAVEKIFKKKKGQ